MKKMNFAILGTGNIAAQMADTVSRMNNVVLYACASRTQEKSEDLRRERDLVQDTVASAIGIT